MQGNSSSQTEHRMAGSLAHMAPTNGMNQYSNGPAPLQKCRNRECSNPRGQPGKPRSIYCSSRCQSREQNLRQGRIKNVRRRFKRKSRDGDEQEQVQHHQQQHGAFPAPAMSQIQRSVSGPAPSSPFSGPSSGTLRTYSNEPYTSAPFGQHHHVDGNGMAMEQREFGGDSSTRYSFPSPSRELTSVQRSQSDPMKVVDMGGGWMGEKPSQRTSKDFEFSFSQQPSYGSRYGGGQSMRSEAQPTVLPPLLLPDEMDQEKNEMDVDDSQPPRFLLPPASPSPFLSHTISPMSPTSFQFPDNNPWA